MHRSSIVLPAPDAPRMLSGASAAWNFSASVKFASFFSIFTSRGISGVPPGCALRVGPIVKTGQQSEGKGDVD